MFRYLHIESFAEAFRQFDPLAGEAAGPDAIKLESYQKTLVTRFVMPMMLGMTTLYFLAYWSFEPRKLAVFVVGVGVALANMALTSRTRVLRIGKWYVHSRSDVVDCARWIVNLAFMDVALVVYIHPSVVGFASGWMILVLSAQADTFQRRHRVLVVALGLGIGAILLARMFPALPVAEYLLVMFCMAASVSMLGVTETYWIREAAARAAAQQERIDAAAQAEQLKQEALMGSYVRTISHEMNNLLTILDLASSVGEGTIAGQEAAMIRRAVAYALKINSLVLRDRQSSSAVRECTMLELAEDLNLLLGREVRRRRLAWDVRLEPEATTATFNERGGSTYFIIHNIVKNAWEAFEDRKHAAGKGRIRVVAAKRGGTLIISVYDDAGGMAEETRLAILTGNADSKKSGGHGLGLRFALSECRRNGFALELETEAGVGSAFHLLIPG